jgi:alkanesulfonate monooxygenase SsuD/methylene tetrahydromethanopterin reductase-like flavin-dependent oxidoreductase (luciferase family)
VRPDLSEDEHFQRFVAGNLVGSPDEVIEQIRSLQDKTRADHLGVAS